jgi:hypothetical protein
MSGKVRNYLPEWYTGYRLPHFKSTYSAKNRSPLKLLSKSVMRLFNEINKQMSFVNTTLFIQTANNYLCVFGDIIRPHSPQWLVYNSLICVHRERILIDGPLAIERTTSLLPPVLQRSVGRCILSVNITFWYCYNHCSFSHKLRVVF